MAAKEIWDYLSATSVTPDYNVVLDVAPQVVLWQDGYKNQIVQVGDDDSEAVISFSDDSIFHVRLQWKNRTESESGTIFDFYHDTTKGNGMARSFKWEDQGTTDAHIYTVRFASKVFRSVEPASLFGFAEIRLRILGRAP